MTRTHTMRRAVREAAAETSSSRELCSIQVISGPTVIAYQDKTGKTKFDVLDHDLITNDLTESQVLKYAKNFFD